MTNTLPKQAQIIIIGGGIIGCSVAYHLAKEGAKDVLLLERGQLTCGSTFHAAGLVGQLRSSANITRVLKNSVELYRTIESETGQATGWKMNGGLRLACTKERWTELKRQATTAHSFGLEMELLSPNEAQELWPLMEVEDVIGAAFLPTDGQANPSDITQALAKGARMCGVTIFEETSVTGIRLVNQQVAAVQTENGEIICETVVNCAGQWANELGKMAGVNVPLVSVEHQYLITEAIQGVTGNLPTLRDPDKLTYWKEEVGGLVMGGYEPNPIAWNSKPIPKDFIFQLLPENFDHFEQLMLQAVERVPALENAGIRKLMNGPESFTPDGNFILGEAPEVKNYFVGAGFNAFGIAAAGGAGKALAEWILAGEPPMDLWVVDIRRFSNLHKNEDWVRNRTLELYGKHYTLSWPHEEHESGRPVLTSPIYEILKEQGACFGSKLGWERPNWFAPEDETAQDIYSYGRQNWFPHVGKEHRAVRERVALFDQSSFAKFRIIGTDAEKALNRICANNVAKPSGALTYTQMLNSKGGIECDLTVARLAKDEFYLVSGTGFRTHDSAWIRSQFLVDEKVELHDITEEWATFSLMGPLAREVLAQVTENDLENDNFPFGTCQNIVIKEELSLEVPNILALRVTYVGELGWELHMPRDSADSVYEVLMEAGKDSGISNAGYRAIESLRLEKSYRAWGADITADTTPFEAGLGWAVKLKSGTDFIGREALLSKQKQPLKKRLACFTINDPDVVLLGRETIYRNGEVVGWLTSGGWGYTVNKNIGYGYVRNPEGVDSEYFISGTYELEVATVRHSCKLQLGPLYDPKMERVRQ
ncbi:MAG: FAD-dependent oxidoreductase [SAR324 cluster bacterium]|nr:FAD-dependent oxidoreductase [SAR324 cluster bacterium]